MTLPSSKDDFVKSARSYEEALTQLYKPQWPHDWPSHVLCRLASVLPFDRVAFLDCAIDEAGEHSLGGRLLVISSDGTLVKVDLDKTTWTRRDEVNSAVTVSRLRGHVQSIRLQATDSDWDAGRLPAKAAAIVLDDGSSIEIPLSNRLDGRDCLPKIMAAVGL